MNLICAGCGNNFIFERKKKYCSAKCCRTKYRRDLGILEFKPSDGKICKHCKTIFYRNTSGVFCKPECRMAHSSDKKQKKIEQRQQKILANQLQRKLASIIRKYARFKDKHHKVCKVCSKEFIATNFGKPFSVCSDECKKQAKKIAYSIHKTTETFKKAKRIRKAKRKALLRSAEIEKIDPLDVFDRDQWICKLCNTATPKVLRGSYELNAPELDHIVPLSRGGSHTINNVRCLCRSCNMNKGNKLDNEIKGLRGDSKVKDLSATSAGRSEISVDEKLRVRVNTNQRNQKELP